MDNNSLIVPDWDDIPEDDDAEAPDQNALHDVELEDVERAVGSPNGG